MLGFYRLSSLEWKPSPVVALATSADSSRVASAREDGSLEIWLVSPGSVGWHCQLTIHGDPNSRVSSLVWCCTDAKDSPCGRLFSSSIDGCVYEWDLFQLKQKIVLHSIGVSIWQVAAAPLSYQFNKEDKAHNVGNGFLNGNAHESGSDTDSEDESGVFELHDESVSENPRVAIACDDGCVRIYSTSDPEELIYNRTLPRVSGRALSVAWSSDASMIFSGSSDGFIRCWDVKRAQEMYRITVGLGGSGSGPELCVWSLLALRNGTIVSADSTGSVHFWDMKHGTLLQTHSYHKGDVNALAVAPNHNKVFSAGSDGQVILYKLSKKDLGSDDAETSKVTNKWVYVGYVRAHTHDVRALTVAVPICKEALQKPEVGDKRKRRKIKRDVDFSYHKWAHVGVPMLISAGDDAKLHAYSVDEYTKFAPHDICPAPQRVPVQLVLDTVFNQNPLLLVQQPYSVDILRVRVRNGTLHDVDPGTSNALATTDLVVRVRSKTARKIICSTMSSSGAFFAYSDHVKPHLYELKKHEAKGTWGINKRELPRKLSYAHCMVFSVDSSHLVLAGHDRRIYVVDVKSSAIVNTFSPSCKESEEELPPSEPPITKMFTSADGQWLAAINCLGDIYIFNLEVQRQHCKISKSHLGNSSITAGGFSPQNNNVLIVTTTSNQVYGFDVEAKQLGEWSKRHSFSLPRRFLEFPGEVVGLCFPPVANLSTVVVYSARAFCLIDFGKPVDQDEELALTNSPDLTLKKLQDIHLNSRLKRKLKDYTLESRNIGRKNFDIHHFREPVLYMGHLSRNSVLIIDKPWLEVVKSFDTAPVHRPIFGT